MKKYCAVFVLFLFLGAFAGAQQLTRFAVVDLPRVYTAFFRDSRAVREYEERSARVQAEVDRMNQEIQNLRSSYVDAEAQGDRERALRLESEMYRKSEFLREYYQAKTAELEDQRRRLAQSNSFLQQVMDEIRFIAESEGYSMVLNLKENTGIIWYSPTVDITEKVIQNLRSKAGR
ncbi:MAG: OmpH family outer membrane protein [Spirochaetaceae bacterium]|jgi:outer membrane protein|nr:OmpH family outer membrane protein [Spirochaetaceae bacterium]